MEVDPNCQCSGCKQPTGGWMGAPWQQTRCVNLPPLWPQWKGLIQPNGDLHSLYSVPAEVQQDSMNRMIEALKKTPTVHSVIYQKIDCCF